MVHFILASSEILANALERDLTLSNIESYIYNYDMSNSILNLMQMHHSSDPNSDDVVILYGKAILKDIENNCKEFESLNISANVSVSYIICGYIKGKYERRINLSKKLRTDVSHLIVTSFNPECE